MTEKNIVIVGGGFGGLRVALDLVRARKKLAGHTIILIDRQKHHLFTPLLYEVASAFLFQKDPEPFSLNRGVAVSFGLLKHIALQNAVQFVYGEVTAIDREKCSVQCGERSISYEYLVLAPGSEPETFGIPGIPEHAYTFRNLQDAMGVHERITQFLAKKRAGKERRVTVVVGGGGPAGVELAAELSKFCEHACARFHLAEKDFQVTIVQAAPRVLPALHPTISRWARERLEHLGVEILLDTCVHEAREGAVVIAPRPLREGETQDQLLCDFRKEKQKVLEADIMVWSGGVRAPALLNNSGFLVDRKGRVDVHDTMVAKGEECIFALGDGAVLLHPETQQPLPELAQIAIFQAELVAKNIVHSIRRETLEHYSYPFLAYMIPAGGKYAFGQFGPIHIRGFASYLLYRMIDLKYFFSILPWMYAWKVWWAGWRAYSKND